MFSNTPIKSRRIRNSESKIHGPPGDQPSHPIRRATAGKLDNRDPNAISLADSIDTGHIARLISNSMARLPENFSDFSQSNISFSDNEITDLQHHDSPFRDLRFSRIDRQYFCTQNDASAFTRADSVSEFPQKSTSGGHKMTVRQDQTVSTFSKFVPGKNKLFQSQSSTFNTYNPGLSSSMFLNSEEVEQEYQRIASTESVKMSDASDNKAHYEYKLSQASGTGPISTKHTILDDDYNSESDEDYKLTHEQDESESEEEQIDHYHKEVLEDLASLQSESYQPYHNNWFGKLFTTLSKFLRLFIWNLSSNKILPWAGFLGLLFSTTYFLLVSYPQLYSNLINQEVFAPSSLSTHDFSKWTKRIIKLEQDIASISHKSNAFETTSTNFLAQLEEQIQVISSSMVNIQDIRETTLAWKMDASNEIRKLESSLLIIKEKLTETTQDFSAPDNQNERNADHLVMDNVSELMNEAGKKIDLLKERIKKLEEAKSVEKAVVDVLEEYLPLRLAVQVDENGKISAVPEFWKYMSAELLNNQSLSLRKEFMLQNQKFIEECNNISLKPYSTGSDGTMVVTKKVFKELLYRDLAALRSETMAAMAYLEKRVGRDIESLAQSQLAHSSVDFGNGTQIALSMLIKQSIQRYISHTIAKVDFADSASGAKVISQHTSKSYDWKKGLALPDFYFHKFLDILGFGRMKVNHPTTAFSSDVRLGSCWPFNGAQGQIGIDLGKRVILSDVGLVHVRADQSPNPSSAPRTVSVHAYIEGNAMRERLNHVLNDGTVEEQETDGNLKCVLNSSFKIPPEYVKIMTFEYDVYNGEEFQVFPVPAYIQRLNVATSRVVFSFENNWGHEDFTCIYRLRLFGEPYYDPDMLVGLERVGKDH